MMGRNDQPQKPLFYAFNLDELIPQDHLLRHIDRFLYLLDLHDHLAPFYSHTGRPSIDPELMIRMLIIGYCRGLRSERQLCEEVKLNLAYRWFCRLGIEDSVPDCFLEYEPETVKVHDLVYRRTAGTWQLYKSFYRKLRLSKEWVETKLSSCRFTDIDAEINQDLVKIIAVK